MRPKTGRIGAVGEFLAPRIGDEFGEVFTGSSSRTQKGSGVVPILPMKANSSSGWYGQRRNTTGVCTKEAMWNRKV